MEFVLTDDQVDKLKGICALEKGVDVEDITENDISEYLDEIIGDL